MAGTQLDADEDLVLVADSAERDEVRAELEPAWRRRLSRLIRSGSTAEDELEELLRRWEVGLPQVQQAWTQINTARDSGTVYSAMGGNVHVHPDLTPSDEEDGRR
jgi:hypothetical protein